MANAPVVILTYLGGLYLVQGEGTVNGIPFYFHARQDCWTMAIGENPVSIASGFTDGWVKQRSYEAGYLDTRSARQIIRECAEEWANKEDQ